MLKKNDLERKVPKTFPPKGERLYPTAWKLMAIALRPRLHCLYGAFGRKTRRLILNQGFEYRVQIDGRGGGLTVLAYLARNYRHSSEEEWQNRLEHGELALDGLRALADDVLKPGQRLVWRRPPWEELDVPLCFAVLYEDEDVLAVAKPSGLPTIPAGGFLEHTLLALVRKRTPKATPMHRLGRGTSGVVLFARSDLARSELSAAFRRKEVRKTYRALSSGIPTEERFIMETHIGPVPHPLLGTVHAACTAGKPALSRIHILERRRDASLLEVTIETGRPHQIRIHLAAAGHPLVGDPLYTDGGKLKDSGVALPGDTGYWLHAERLSLCHPATGSPFEVWCCPPPELRFGSRRDGGEEFERTGIRGLRGGRCPAETRVTPFEGDLNVKG
jgi:23S rRNA pseudouridine1911/1915/1917 synthase